MATAIVALVAHGISANHEIRVAANGGRHFHSLRWGSSSILPSAAYVLLPSY